MKRGAISHGEGRSRWLSHNTSNHFVSHPCSWWHEIQICADVERDPHRYRDISPATCSLPVYNVRTPRHQHQAHSSAQKAANVAGLGENMPVIPTGRGGGPDYTNADALDAAALAVAIKEDIAAGLTPVFVFANVGSTNSCAVDPVRAMAEICRRWKVALLRNWGDWEQGGGAYLFFNCFCYLTIDHASLSRLGDGGVDLVRCFVLCCRPDCAYGFMVEYSRSMEIAPHKPCYDSTSIRVDDQDGIRCGVDDLKKRCAETSTR